MGGKIARAFLLSVSILPALAAGTGDAALETPLPEPAFEIEPSRSDAGRPVRPQRDDYDGPIVDTHVHLDPPSSGQIEDSPLEQILRAAETAGVAHLYFMPTPNEGRFRHHEVGASQKLRLKELGGDKVGVLCGGNYLTYWMHGAFKSGYSESDLQNVIERLSEDISSGHCAGIGEIGLFHFNKSGHQAVIENGPGFAPFLAVVETAAANGTWLDLHAEPVEPNGKSRAEEVFGGLALWFARFPKLKLILSHTAMTNPTNARRILEAYPGVMMNLKFTRNRGHWRHLGPIANSDGILYEDWARLMEAMPERFMVGSDAKFGRHRFPTSKYAKEIKRFRRLLGSLDPEAAHRIAQGNAMRVFAP